MSRRLAALGALAAGLAVSTPSAGTALANPWTGAWSRPPSEIGGMAGGVTRLTQTGARVTGSYNWGGGGRLSGTVSGATLTGTWADSAGGGTMTLTVRAGARSFAGRWQGRSGSAAGQSGSWSGTYVGMRPATPTTTATTAPGKKLFRFGWAAKGEYTNRAGGTTYRAALRGQGTITIDGAGKILKATGGLTFVHTLDLVQDLWKITLAGGRYHEDPGPTAELRVRADSHRTRRCDARRSGTLTLFDGEGKRVDYARLRVCGALVRFRTFEQRDESGSAAVVIGELR